MQMFQRVDKDVQEQLMPSRYISDLEAAGALKPELQLTCWVPSKCSTWTFCIYSSGAVSFKLTEVMARTRACCQDCHDISSCCWAQQASALEAFL